MWIASGLHKRKKSTGQVSLQSDFLSSWVFFPFDERHLIYFVFHKSRNMRFISRAPLNPGGWTSRLSQKETLSSTRAFFYGVERKKRKKVWKPQDERQKVRKPMSDGWRRKFIPSQPWHSHSRILFTAGLFRLTILLRPCKTTETTMTFASSCKSEEQRVSLELQLPQRLHTLYENSRIRFGSYSSLEFLILTIIMIQVLKKPPLRWWLQMTSL